jgi:hypothetical protein
MINKTTIYKARDAVKGAITKLLSRGSTNKQHRYLIRMDYKLSNVIGIKTSFFSSDNNYITKERIQDIEDDIRLELKAELVIITCVSYLGYY